MTATEAAELLYRVALVHQCTCVSGTGWPWRKKIMIDGKMVDPPDVICRRCVAIHAWETTREHAEAFSNG